MTEHPHPHDLSALAVAFQGFVDHFNEVSAQAHKDRAKLFEAQSTTNERLVSLEQTMTRVAPNADKFGVWQERAKGAAWLATLIGASLVTLVGGLYMFFSNGGQLK